MCAFRWYPPWDVAPIIIKMAFTDPKSVAGVRVQALARRTTHPSECKRHLGSNWNTKIAVGTVVVWQSCLWTSAESQGRKQLVQSSPFGRYGNPETGVMDTQRETTNVGNVKRAAAASVREAQFPSTASTACCSCWPAQCRCSVCAKLC